MYKLCFCSQKECRKCIFWQYGDLNFKKFSFAIHPGDISWRQRTKETVINLNLWRKTAVDQSAWIAWVRMVAKKIELLLLLAKQMVLILLEERNAEEEL